MSEFWFWFATVLMLLISIAIFVIPMYAGKEQNEATSRDELNKAFFQDRLNELNAETKEGLVDNQDELVVELKQSLLDDIPVEQNKIATKHFSAVMLLPGILILIVLSFGLYNVFGHYREVVAWQNSVSRLSELSEKLMSDTEETMTDQEMNDLTLSLRTQLQQTPNDALGWLLLGRIALANRDIRTAEAAMAKSYQLSPNDTDIKLGYAQSLMLTSDETNVVLARQLLSEVIRADHGNLQAFSLLAFDAFERGAFDEAIAAWSTMKQLLPADDSRIMMLDRSIERAKGHAKGQGQVGNQQGVSVTISLATEVVLPKEAMLVVYVHSPDGDRMPIAAKRLPLDQFPVDVDFSDADSMIPERLLSSLSEVRVTARIDSDGNVMTKEGDWFGESEPFLLGGSSMIVINQKY